VADVRASTPSNAAELVVPDKRDFLSGLVSELEQMEHHMHHAIAVRQQRVDGLLHRISSKLEAPLVRFGTTVTMFWRGLDRLAERLVRQKEFVASSERLFKNVDHTRVLARGFAIARTATGAIVRAADELDKGDKVVLEFGHGRADTSIEKIYE
jgi:exodeoxyribonuclease VII large subunit